DFTATANEHYQISGACLAVVGTTCAMVETMINMGSKGTQAKCLVAGTGCDCTATRTVPIDSRGTYTTSGSVLTTVATGGDTSNLGYCVDGNELWIESGPPAGGVQPYLGFAR